MRPPQARSQPSSESTRADPRGLQEERTTVRRLGLGTELRASGPRRVGRLVGVVEERVWSDSLQLRSDRGLTGVLHAPPTGPARLGARGQGRLERGSPGQARHPHGLRTFIPHGMHHGVARDAQHGPGSDGAESPWPEARRASGTTEEGRAVGRRVSDGHGPCGGLASGCRQGDQG